MVDMMILRSVSILTSSEPFSRPDLSSCVPGYSALLSNTTVWQEGSDMETEKCSRGKLDNVYKNNEIMSPSNSDFN